jgi:PLP dependent protein
MEADGGDAFKDRYRKLRERITEASRRAGRDPATVKLIAVTKSVPVETIREAAAQGCTVFGENRVQEAIGKMEVLRAEELEWHLIGPLQSNKVKSVAGRFSLIHSIDRLEVAERLDRLVRERELVQPVLLEVNVGGERTKHGFDPDDLIAAAQRMGCLTGLRLVGLMAIPPPAKSPEQSRPHFRFLKELASRIERQNIAGVRMRELSMGMSADFETAIEEGATMVRIGTALFGPRANSEDRPSRFPEETLKEGA